MTYPAMTLHERLADYDGCGEILLADGFDAAFIGIGERCGQPAVAVYDRDRCIDTLVIRDGMSHEDAEEFFDFNVVGAWVGPKTPVFVSRLTNLREETP